MRLFCAIVSCLLLANVGFAQNTDFMTWNSVATSIKLNKKTSVDIEQELRFANNSTMFSKSNTTLSAAYDVTKKVKVGVGYRIIYANELDDGKTYSQRIMINVAGRKKVSNFTISLRERFQADFSKINRTELYLRHKLSAKYRGIEKIDVKPYAELELFQSLNNAVGNRIDRQRIFAGVTYSLIKSLEIDLAYGLQHTHKMLKNEKTYYVLRLGLLYEF